MKHRFILFAAAALAMVACDKNNSKEETKPLEADMTMTVTEIVYGEPANLEGTITSTVAIDEMVVTAVRKSGESYTAVGEAQPFAKPEAEYKAIEYFADSQELTDLEITLKAGKAAKTFYFPVEVKGGPKGNFYYNDLASLVADGRVDNHFNNPELYPEEGTGAGSDTKSFFSMHGVDVNGTREHILSLNELRPVDGKDFSMGWCNVWKNTENNVTLGSSRGYAFYYAKEWTTSGGIGRQCDGFNVNGHAIDPKNADDFKFQRIKGSWAGESYDEALYTTVAKIFNSIDKKPETKLDEIKAYWAMGEVQRQLDNSTLGVEDNPTSLSLGYLLRRWSNCTESAKVQATDNFRAGDFLVIRSTRGTADNPLYYYGIMRIEVLPDETAVWTGTNAGGFPCIDKEKGGELFGGEVFLNIKCQCELR